MMRVMTVKPAPAIIVIRLRPILSPRFPKITPPTGRASRVTVKTMLVIVAFRVSDMDDGSK